MCNDERESGERGLLNFGHTIGHAIEALMTPEMLHGECVAIGIVLECEISRARGHLTSGEVSRISRLLQAFQLPIRMPKGCPLDRLMHVMRVDKKNSGAVKRVVLLSGVGNVMERRASLVTDAEIEMALAPAIRLVPPTRVHEKVYEMAVPGSKSISNRALLLAALGSGTCRLSGLLFSDDVQVSLSLILCAR